ncbi:hypothetical protein A2716_03225 [candidate division WWE3 bacterium RIFCSPHIGHO2_01_FULL_40_23]|uniref:Aspartyl/glutamyl-tRNA(Asn/Gln) amidotransferase subunit C n=1 Tax=candidate division WWE3 bacterium RIFCSPLOWO2_01_FULL_41_18 TaxID=1802625 RepID=A0A1F4VCG4_UNCKA|nr:MAG: hypothetical protein A2716_03225 [candidate division WWE3 bacterium RIFCSPHIGHO2_01_FULL_40_23]OGC54895.1 MAG: hypothetical protein A3A78_02835 [candidate division WWE3 bacterium RIFCSPLOWO2_01_FULL_41_18]
MISTSDVEKVARLSKLEISGTEVKKFQTLLSEAIDYIKVLNELDTTDIKPTSQVSGKVNIFDEDFVRKSLSMKDVLRNAKEKKESFFVTKSVIKKNEKIK